MVTTTNTDRDISRLELHEAHGTARGSALFGSWQIRSVLTPFGWLALLSIVAAAALGAVLASTT